VSTTPLRTTTSHVHLHGWPLYWFAALEKAIEDGNLTAAQEARAHLQRLGVTVTYRHRRKRPAGPKGGSAA
jgi:hypothetical protein